MKQSSERIVKVLIINSFKFSNRYLTRFIYHWKRDNSPLLIVFAYHGVTEKINVARLSYGLQILKEDFERHCRIIASNFRPQHIDEFLQQKKVNNDKVYVLLSFDDIYQNVLTTALPLLEEYRLKFMVFPVTDYISSPAPFWWDKVRFAFLATPFSTLSIGRQIFDLSTLAARESSIFTFEAYLASLDKESREALVAEVYSENLPYICSVFGKILDDFRPVDQESLEGLKNNPLCQIGLHTASHSSLPDLSQEHLEQELHTSQQWYQQLFHEPAQDICYPFGATNQRVDEICQKYGFRRGFILDARRPARVRRSENSNSPYLAINRYILHPYDNWDSIRGKGTGFYDPFLKVFGADWL